MHLFIIGAGHVGLVSASGFRALGHRVTVADVQEQRIERLRDGIPPIYEPGLQDAVREGLADGTLAFQVGNTPPADVAFSFVAVSTPPGPDGALSTAHVRAAVGDLLANTGPDHTIVIRSTLPLGGPAELIALRGDRADAPAIVTNPEFMREGSGIADFLKPDRVVAGWLEARDRGAAESVLQLYEGVDAPRLVADAASAALIKLASNVFLATKIAFANELARVVEAYGGDVRIVADGIGMDARIGRGALNAGPGFGGSCLPEQAIALAELAAARSVPTPLVDAITASNGTHQQAIVDRLAAHLADGRLGGCRVAVLGLAFKARTDDVRESPALALVARLREAGASVVASDPRAGARASAADPELVLAASVEVAVEGADAVLIATEWPEYGSLDWAALRARMAGDLVYDTRAIVDAATVRAAGLRLVRLGEPDA
jgi:UDPglucose 6-dehydrogenase